MKKILLSEKTNYEFKREKPKTRIEFIGFVADQFKKLAKKNLRVPITLYHL